MTAFLRIGMRLAVLAICISVSLANAQSAFGQIFGIELHNNVMPASGGMGGASVAQPQDLLSAINGNPATMSQYRGTQFSFGGAWIEPTVNLDHNGGVLPGIGTFSGKSGTPGSVLGNIGVTRELSDVGLPITAGVALISASGLGVDYAAQPNSNNSAVTIQILQLQPELSIQLTDRLAIGGSFGLGVGLFDGLFVGSSKATPDYGTRGSIGVTFDPNPSTKIGFYYQTKESFNFENSIVLQPFIGPPSVPLDVRGALPPNIALGFANSSLANGRLLLATDLVYKFWEEATLFDALWTNQFIVQVGAQYTTQKGRKIRLGYTYAEETAVDVPGNVIAGITPPGAANAIQYGQGLIPNISPNRFSCGFGVPNVLPGVDLDIFGGGQFLSTATFGRTTASLETYFLGGGLTFRCGRGSGCKELLPNDVCCLPGVERTILEIRSPWKIPIRTWRPILSHWLQRAWRSTRENYRNL